MMPPLAGKCQGPNWIAGQAHGHQPSFWPCAPPPRSAWRWSLACRIGMHGPHDLRAVLL